MPRLRLDPFSPNGVSIATPQSTSTVVERRVGVPGGLGGQTTNSTDSRFTDYQGAMRASDEIDLATRPLIMRDSAGSDWGLSITTLGALYSSPVWQDEAGDRVLDEAGDLVVME